MKIILHVFEIANQLLTCYLFYLASESQRFVQLNITVFPCEILSWTLKKKFLISACPYIIPYMKINLFESYCSYLKGFKIKTNWTTHPEYTYILTTLHITNAVSSGIFNGLHISVEQTILQLCLVAWPLNASEARVDLVLIETSLLF